MAQHPFFQFLQNRLQQPLPGRAAHMKMCPVPLDPDFVLPVEDTETAHPSSVLIPICPAGDQALHIILTLRTESIRHAGQISFPGGRKDPHESLEETALRETEEEIGIGRSQVELAGSITPLYLHRTDNRITPFIGFVQHKPILKPNPFEVEEAFTVSMDELANGKNIRRGKWALRQTDFDVPYWNIHRVPLWGATAMIMSELVELYREFLDNS